MPQYAGVFECRCCGRTWVDELPQLWEEWWPECCLTKAWLLLVLMPAVYR
jgi:hypothetical protein